MTSFVLIYGPPKSGKTLNAVALAGHYGCVQIADAWSPGLPTPDPENGCVLLLAQTSSAVGLAGHEVRCIPISAARIALGTRWIEPKSPSVVEVDSVDPVDDQLDALALVAIQWHRNRLAGRRPRAVRSTFLAVIADFRQKELEVAS